jgi:chromate transporter
MILVWILAAMYDRYQVIPQVGGLLYGIKPVMIAIIGQALWKLAIKAIRDVPTAIATIAILPTLFYPINEVLLLVLAGLTVMLIKNLRPSRGTLAALLWPGSGWMAQLNLASQTAPQSTTQAVSGIQVFLFFLKVGSVLYGSGYVLLAFLQRDLVERYQWLTTEEVIDAVAIGQFTPGPVLTTATFVGYLLAGSWGAIAATVGIFLPAFVLVWAISPWVPHLRRSRWLSGFLDGVNAASLGLMATVTYTLMQTALVDWFAIGLAALAAMAVFRFQVNSAWVVGVGGLAGLVAQQWLG